MEINVLHFKILVKEKPIVKHSSKQLTLNIEGNKKKKKSEKA